MPIKHIGKTPTQQMNEIKKIIHTLPLKVANTAYNAFLDNFKTESFFGRKWQKRSGWDTRPSNDTLLRRTPPVLYRSLMRKASGNNAIVWVDGMADEYGYIHNTGGTITIPPNPASIGHFWKMFYAAPSGVEKSRWKAMALAMKSGKSLRVKIPQRQFIGNHNKLMQLIHKKIESEISKINKL